jgi:broad specificity phosphatase PhoE
LKDRASVLKKRLIKEAQNHTSGKVALVTHSLLLETLTATKFNYKGDEKDGVWFNNCEVKEFVFDTVLLEKRR